MKKINLDTDLLESKNWSKRKLKSEVTSITILIALFVVVVIVLGHDFSHKEPKPVLKPISSHGNAVASPRNLAMTEFFRRKGSPDPHGMASAVLGTKRPRLMASIAIRESNGNPKAVGDGGKSKGAFQVQKHWGKVSHDPVEQAKQSERILEELLADNNGNLKKALSAYNGEKTKKVYADKILASLTEIP